MNFSLALRSALMTRLTMFGRVDELAAIEAFLEPVPPEPSACRSRVPQESGRPRCFLMR